ncbi:TetR family transcriptional regulator [Zafaria cholistanensis]|uniref:TetR family transcriptional regulator n=1 Tax=Zafaria cholistanensis TaxID=1682741 RepID=A0A5A7NUF3_9MICC|nr:TetR/AcrR family transcriptional regulator [Zafaria cholistanensis]GER24443.1 TetR family transcriptional regulator [Zafaria cholistanensis]
MNNEAGRPSYGAGREALMSAVMRIVATKGLRGVTYRAVAAEAGVNHNLISHHFGSIETLLNATMELAVERAIKDTELALFADFDERYVDALIASVSAEPEVHLFQFEMLLEARRHPELRDSSRRLYENYVSSVHDGLRRRGVEADDDLCSAVFAALDGLMLQFLTIGDPVRIRAAVKRVGQLLASAVDHSQDAPGYKVPSQADLA